MLLRNTGPMVVRADTLGASKVAVRNFPTDPFSKWVDLDGAATGPVRGAEAIVQSIVISDVFTGSHFTVYLSR